MYITRPGPNVTAHPVLLSTVLCSLIMLRPLRSRWSPPTLLLVQVKECPPLLTLYTQHFITIYDILVKDLFTTKTTL